MFEVKRLLRTICVHEERERRNTLNMIFIDSDHPRRCSTSPYDINHPTEPIEGDNNFHLTVHVFVSSHSSPFQSSFQAAEDTNSSLGVQYLFAHFTLRWHQLCDRLRVTPTSQSCTNVPDGNPQAAELIKQEKAPRIIYQSDSGAQAEQLTCCSPFIWRCGCCFHAS